VYYDGTVYNIAGATYHIDTGTSKVEIYDLETDVWSSGPDYPASYGGLKCVVADATIVCAGGYISNKFKAEAFSMDLSASELKWETLPSLSDSRTMHGMASANGYVYVIAGYCAHYCYSNTVEVLDLSDPTSWLITTDANKLPDTRYSPTATSANGKIYVIGGYITGGEYSSYLVGEATYPSTSSWEVVDYVGPSEWDTYNLRVHRYSYYSKVTGVTVVYTKTTSSIGFFSVANV
jgi:N-acetylneuraminic acid mutarotase